VADLFDLMVSLDGLSPEEVEARGRELYARQYLNHGHYGIHATHDGETLVFHKSQFDHAFFTTSDRLCHPERKDVVRRASIERILWIEQLVSGNVPGSACFEVPSPTGRRRLPNRLYAVYKQPLLFGLSREKRVDGSSRRPTRYPSKKFESIL
jgi:hypothetical protein